MKILHVITGLETGGAEIALCRLLEAETQPTWEHSVVALGSEAALSIRVRQAGVRLSHLNMNGARPNPLALWRLGDILHTERPSIVQGWMYHANLAVTLSPAVIGIPVVWGIHHSLYEIGFEKPLTRAAIRFGVPLSKYPYAIIYNARTSATQHEALGYRHDKTWIIPNGFDTCEFRPDSALRASIRASLRIAHDSFVVGLVARWHPMKDHENFIRAASTFAQAYPKAIFVLVGEGVDFKNEPLVDLARTLEIVDRIRLCGRREDIAAISATFDIATSSSWSEACPNTLGEAMSCGVPCVATDVGDTANLIGDTGIVVPPRDPVALAAGWKRLAALEPGVRQSLGARARQRIVEHYEVGEMHRRYLQLYGEISDSAHARRAAERKCVRASPKRRVLLFANSSWFLWNFRVTLARRLSEEDWEVVFVAPADDYSGRLAEVGQFVPLKLNRKGRNPIIELWALVRVIHLLRALRPDVVLTWTPKANIYGALAGGLLATPVIPNVTGLGFAFVRRSWLAQVCGTLYRLAFRRHRVVFFENSDDRDQFMFARWVQKGSARLIPGAGVDLKRFRPRSPRPHDGFVFLFVGRLIADKGLRELVEAVRIVTTEGLDARLRLAGLVDPGNPTTITESEIRAWEREAIVEYLGATDAVEVPVADSDCVVLPSYREGMPRVLLEASACARPIITTDTPGCREAVRDGITGFLCKPGDVASLAQAMRKMMALSLVEREAMGKAGRELMKQTFAEEIVIDTYLAALSDVLRLTSARAARGESSAVEDTLGIRRQ